jgi:flagellar basal-body rod protein FlgF
MLNSLFITLSGKYVIERKMEAISNNLANASTAGYKAVRPVFKMLTTDTQTPSDVTLPHTAINDLDTHIYFSEAPIIETGNSLDVTIQGSGFFVVSGKDGNIYTRNGQFALDQNKRLVTLDGKAVMGQNGEITLDGKDIRIGDDGSIYVDGQQAGQLKIVDFADKTTLRNLGRSSFVNMDPAAAENTPDKVTVKQGYYETSNVNVVAEMVDMMSAVRAYESYGKVDQAMHDIMSKLLDITK